MKKSVRRTVEHSELDAANLLVSRRFVRGGIYKSDSILIRPLMTLWGMRDECGEEADICEV